MPTHTVTITFEDHESAHQMKRHLKIAHELESEIREE